MRRQIGDIIRPRNSDPVCIMDIKQGGWGTVYLVKDLSSGTTRAVKLLQERFIRNELVVRRFIQEAHLWIRLGSHPNIVTADFADTINGRPCLFLEYVDGGSLRPVISFGPLPSGSTMKLALQLARGMRFVWRNQIVHRDLKPENVMLTRAGQVKITDFGLAQAIGVGGTHQYMAPEQFNSAQVDTRTDIYAFGLILFEMLTSTIPHLPSGAMRLGKRGLDALASRRNREPAPDPRSLNPGIPATTASLVLACLKTDPNERPTDFDAVCGLLQSFERPVWSGKSILGVGTDDAASPPTDGADKALDLNNEAASLANLGRYEEALPLFDQAISADPSSGLVWKNKSSTLLELGRHEEALVCAEEALALISRMVILDGAKEARSTELMSWTTKIAALGELERHEDALTACERALQLKADYPPFFNNKGAVLVKLGRLDEALICIKRAIELDADYEKAWNLRGLIEAQLGNLETSLSSFERLLSINPRNFEGIVGKAQCLSGLGRSEEAAQLLTMAEKVVSPQLFRTFFTKKLADARKTANRNTDITNVEAVLGLGDFSQLAGEYQLAAEFYDYALESDSMNASTWVNKGHCLYELGQTAAAITCFEKALELEPNNSVGLMNLSRFYLDSGDWGRALTFAENALRVDNRNDMALNNKGVALSHLGRWGEAAEEYHNALQLNPNNILAWSNLGACRLRSGDLRGAETCFLEALALKPDFEAVRDMLEMCGDEKDHD
jgi:eukaryotic-like serine/threonine-protein kinase